jgi:IS5 family transposase
MDQIAVSSASKTLHRALERVSRWCAFRSAAERKRRSVKAYEKSADFKQGQRFRAGIEGRISVLFRGRGMKRCLAEGHERFELWVAAAVLANNLMNIAALLTRRASRRRKAI